MSDTQHMDRALARRILKGDEAAFTSLFDRFFPRLYRFALHRTGGNPDLAGEMVQQTFRKAIERLDTYRGEAALYSWFCQICRNTIIDWHRSNQRERATVVPLEDQANVRAVLESLTAPATDLPETATWQRETRRLVQATVDVLPQNYGDVLEWKYIDGLSVSEIADRLQTGVKAAESLLTRARSAFRKAMGEIADSTEAMSPP